MKKALYILAVAVAASAMTAAPASAQANTNPIAANAFINFGGLDWAWASPCAAGCSQVIITQNFRYATAAEWAARPTAFDFLDPAGNFSGSGQTFRCAAQYFDPNYSHCDWDDAVNNYVSSGPTNGYPEPSNSETWLVRDQVVATPEPATFGLLATGLLGVFGIARRRKA